MIQSEEEWAAGRTSRQLVGRSLFHVLGADHEGQISCAHYTHACYSFLIVDECISVLDATGGQIRGAFRRQSVLLSDMCNEGILKGQTLFEWESGRSDEVYYLV